MSLTIPGVWPRGSQGWGPRGMDSIAMRRYNKWFGNPKGDPEDPRFCIAEVPDRERPCAYRQCESPRGCAANVEMCAMHARMTVNGTTILYATTDILFRIPPEEQEK